jgi:serine/threonine protein phosphatase 1
MIYVMSDIHGNARRFRSIMEQINLQADDTLYVLGDVIDRFPDGIRILRSLMRMGNAHLLLGNHEHMMMTAIDNPKDTRTLELWYRNGGRVTHDYIKHLRKSIRAEIFDYLKALPLNVDITVNDTAYKLVHGAPVEMFETHGWRYSNKTEFAVWYRWRGTESVPDGYTMIFGHTPTEYYQSDYPLKIWFDENRIGIDCGSGYAEAPQSEYAFQGRLACLRLNDMQEFYSKETEMMLNGKKANSA